MAKKQTPKGDKPSTTPAKVEKTSFIKTKIGKEFLNDDRQIASGVDFETLLEAHDTKIHVYLKRADFADAADWCELRAIQADDRAEKAVKDAATLREEADNIRRFGDPEKRRLVQKAQKMRDSLATIKESLAADGIDLAELGL